MLAEIITVFLEDQGQDFLEWDIKDGVVVACRRTRAGSGKAPKFKIQKSILGTTLRFKIRMETSLH